jgi:hypothetical protein
LVVVGVIVAPAVGSAQERFKDGAIGAITGAVVAGPVGAIAGGAVGYAAGPNIARGLGLKGRHHRYTHSSYKHRRVVSQ